MAERVWRFRGDPMRFVEIVARLWGDCDEIAACSRSKRTPFHEKVSSHSGARVFLTTADLRDGERWGEMGEIWGDLGRSGEIWGDLGRYGRGSS